jgi:hypothetical protein
MLLQRCSRTAGLQVCGVVNRMVRLSTDDHKGQEGILETKKASREIV